MHKLALVIVSIFSVLVSTPGFSDDSPIAKVIATSPSTTFEGKKITDSSLISSVGTLRTGRDGGAKLKMLANEALIDIAASSEVKILKPANGDPSEVIEIISGSARAHVKALKNPSKDRTSRPTFTIRTKSVTMGARGTDFLGTVTPVLNEAEIIVFEGKVEFISTADAQDAKMVSAGYWGGIGGRYGMKTHELIKLSPEALEHFKKIAQDVAPYSMEKQTVPANQSETGH